MVAQILRLKLRLLGNSFRRSPWQLLGLGLGALYGFGTAVLVLGGLVSLRFFDVDVATSAVVVLGSVVLVVFTVLPLILGIDDTLDPRKFALFGIRNNTLAFGLAAASFISVPTIVVAIMAFAQIATWSRDALSAGLAVVAAVLIIVTSVLSARISTSVAAFLLATRRARDITAIIGLVALVSLSPAIIALVSVDWAKDGLDVLAKFAGVLSWTPFGAAWSIPADAAAGDPGTSMLKLLIAVAWVAVLALGWRALVAAMLVTPQRQAQAKKYSGLGWFGLVPGTPTGVIAARSITYWLRDSRYGTSLIVIPLIPLFMVIALSIGGIPLAQLALLPVPVICLFLSWSVHNDVAFDNTAVWLHLSASTSGRADRWGRLLPALVLGILVIGIGGVVSAAVFGDWSVLPSIVGVSTSVLFTGLGLSSIMSARFPYPAVRPGDSPFAQPQSGSPAGLIQALSFFAILLLTAPALVAAALGFLQGGQWPLVSLAAGVVIGVAVLLGGVAVGGRVFERRGSQILAFSMRS
ncbi:ABC-2 type transport system permease protein [Conyzicola lurida]|uniref:ABC-2 type transport system permease protein n=1 Tax=Conyzicola lurida TaxID=1172621 RepID=A0A841AH25_9MICO|nr:ABC-2 type transport system permease protein [Conyzicola lurida]